MQASKYQQDFYDEVKNTNNNLILKAGAGAGKTTSIVEACKLIPKYKKTIFLAFNKSIAQELQEKLPSHVEASTIHSLGYKVLAKNLRTRMKLSQYKTISLAKNSIEGKEFKDKKEELKYKFAMQDIINFARVTKSPRTQEHFKALTNKYGILSLTDEHERSLHLMEDLDKYNRGRHKEYMIDFNDMVALPTEMNMEFPQYDYVLCDEVQDENNVQHAFIEKVLKPNGRIIGVGDSMQSIYGFQGANSDSMDLFKQKFNCKELPLSICYRCGTDIVEHARKINPALEPFDKNSKGEIIHGSDLSKIEKGDILICRNTKPLITAFFKLLDMEKKATVVGKDMMSSVRQLLNSMEEMSAKEATYSLNEQKEYIIEQLKEDGVAVPKNHKKYVIFEEKADIIVLLLEKYDYISGVKAALKDIFDNDKAEIKLMTAHKSKGLEADRVFYLHKFENKRLIPSKYAESKEEKQQELNLEYVIRTRAKKELHYIAL